MLEPIFCLLIRRTPFGASVPYLNLPPELPAFSQAAKQHARRSPRPTVRTNLPLARPPSGLTPSNRRPAFGRRGSFFASCGFSHVERIPRTVPDMDDR